MVPSNMLDIQQDKDHKGLLSFKVLTNTNIIMTDVMIHVTAFLDTSLSVFLHNNKIVSLQKALLG